MTHALIGLLLGALGGATPAVHRANVVISAPSVTRFLPAARAEPAPEPILIDWKTLNDLNVDTGKAPTSLMALEGKHVKIAAFIVPLEDDLQEADEFLLVPYFGACVHTPPPPANQMVYVRMPAHKTVTIGWWDPVVFEGVLHIKQVDSPFGAVAYEMDGVASAPYKPKKP